MPKKVRCITDYWCCLYKGKIYDVLGIEDGMYQIIDESGDCYLYGPGNFEIIEESAVYDTVKMKHRKSAIMTLNEARKTYRKACRFCNYAIQESVINAGCNCW